MSKKIGKLLIIIGFLFLFLSLVLFLNNYFLMKTTERDTNYLLEELNRKIENKELDGESYIEINKNKYIGKVDIPNLNISLPVLKEISDMNLIIAPCQYFEDVDKGQMIIAAHNYPKYFGNLKYLKIDDLIIFTNIYGNEFKYNVELIEYIKPKNVEEMINTNFDLTLFTCNNSRTLRITIRCNHII